MRRTAHTGGRVAVVIAALLAATATRAQDPKTPRTEPKLPALDYYPMKEGNTWTYAFIGGKQTLRAKVVKATSDKNGLQATLEWSVRQDDAQEWTKFQTEVYRATSEALLRLRVGPEEEGKLNPPLPVLRFPLKAGEKWTWKGKKTFRSQSAVFLYELQAQAEEEIKTPAGTFKAIRIHIEDQTEPPQKKEGAFRPTRLRTAAYPQDASPEPPKAPLRPTNDYWFAPGVGMVQQRVRLPQAGVQEIQLTAYTVK
jgi:hypothetical protein